MFVRPERRGLGIGRTILDALEEFARRDINARSILLETGVLNAAAIGLYEAVGYHPVASYADGRDPAINRAFRRELSLQCTPAHLQRR